MKRLNLGVINIMPNAGEYAKLLDRALSPVRDFIDVYPIRLSSHEYRSSREEVACYTSYCDLVRQVRLDLLLVTGAPVEHLPFEEVAYFPELLQIFEDLRGRAVSIMGICFGGLAIARYLDIDKRVHSDKIFGVYPVTATLAGKRYIADGRDCFYLPMSTWALLEEEDLIQHPDRWKSLMHHPSIGHVMLSSRDEQFIVLLGHPEYTGETLYREWQRDVSLDIAYTREFQARSFDDIARQLEHGGCPIISNWIASHVGAPAATG